jgi:aspartyl-tRNA(Asn)/glutamyl-tRNA(Gln) amidotransferase subunit B
VSLKRKTDTRLGTRTEIKNLNSIGNVRKAIEYEIKRQKGLLSSGKAVIQETLSYDDQRNITFPLRSKEEAEDYRYFPEPDLNPAPITEDLLSRVRSEMPKLPDELYRKFTLEYKLGTPETEILVESADVAAYFDALASGADPKTSANWVLGPVKSWLNEHQAGMEDFPLKTNKLRDIIRATEEGMVSNTAARQRLFPALLEQPDHDVIDLAIKLDLVRETGEEAIMKQVEAALDKYPEKIDEYHRGKKGLIGLFMGEVMKSSGGRADPGTTKKLILNELANRKK